MSEYEMAFATGMFLCFVIIGILALIGVVLGYRSINIDGVGGPMG